MGLHGAVKNTEQEMFYKDEITASTVDSNYHMAAHLPLAFHQGNCVCTVVVSMLKGPVSAATMKWTLYIYPHVKKSRTVTAVDTRVQHGFQLPCDPA